MKLISFESARSLRKPFTQVLENSEYRDPKLLGFLQQPEFSKLPNPQKNMWQWVFHFN